MNRLERITFQTFRFFIILFFCFAFINWNIDPAEWSSSSRWWFAVWNTLALFVRLL